MTEGAKIVTSSVDTGEPGIRLNPGHESCPRGGQDVFARPGSSSIPTTFTCMDCHMPVQNHRDEPHDRVMGSA